MAVAVWGAAFKNADFAITADGGFVAVAVKIGTSPLEVWFKRSADGGTSWPADGAAVLVGTLGTSNQIIRIEQKTVAGRATLVITNGVDRMWISNDMGISWTAL